MATGVNYGYCADDFMLKYDKYRYALPQEYGNNIGYATTLPMNNDSYASGITDAGFSANTCTDGKEDGKIGIDGVLLNLGEGILKGAWNGIVGAVTDSNGKFSLGKTLLSVGMVGACVAFPALGAIACGIGAIAGGNQVIKGAKVAFSAKTDAEAKAAWENIGEGGSTVVGCALGAKASIGAMKSTASLSAIDDIVKSTDDIAKILGNTDDIAASLDDTAKLTKFLKSKGIDNASEIINANKNGFSSIDEMIEAVSKQGKMSQLSQVGADDSLHGIEKWTKTAKAFVDDAISSSKNSGKKVIDAAQDVYKGTKSYLDYKMQKRSLNKNAQTVGADSQITSETLEIAKNKVNESNFGKKLINAEQQSATKKANIEQIKQNGADKNAKLKETLAQQKDNLETTNHRVKVEKKASKGSENSQVSKFNKRLAKTQEAQKGNVRQTQAQIVQNKVDTVAEMNKEALSNNTFGNLTSRAKAKSKTYQYLTNNEKSSILKNIKNIKLSDVAKNLGSDGKEILTFLQQTDSTYAQAVQQFGYDNVMEVLKVVFAYGQTNQMV